MKANVAAISAAHAASSAAAANPEGSRSARTGSDTNTAPTPRVASAMAVMPKDAARSPRARATAPPTTCQASAAATAKSAPSITPPKRMLVEASLASICIGTATRANAAVWTQVGSWRLANAMMAAPCNVAERARSPVPSASAPAWGWVATRTMHSASARTPRPAAQGTIPWTRRGAPSQSATARAISAAASRAMSVRKSIMGRI
jgi:hypothetical protein